ncbi:MAG TPA: IclR family transcriptional regulator C-terminal domain-containing protein, partial [Beijerinckiaceae bacterium]|nr:IclR family transcriptional regulator C-terminal domain-containing protein [Beijerinckiaceae bacterium]
PGGQPTVSYERGRPMPLFVGATSKIILAYLAARDLKSLYESNSEGIEKAKLGADWNEFKAALSAIRKAGHVTTRSEVDPERIGVAAPILDDRRAIGSLSFVIPSAEERRAQRLVPLVVAGAREIEAGMRALNGG